MDKVTVLSVDDEERFRSALRRSFHLRRGTPRLTLLEAGTGHLAIDVLTQTKVDCILLDYQMPGGNGIEWLKRILEAHPQVAVIMVTGKGDESTAVEAMKCGAMDYLVKGVIRQDDLVRAILNAIEKRRMRDAIREQSRRLLEAERQRVMIESLGAACHHLGQPATVITMYLSMLNKQETSHEKQKLIEDCMRAADDIAGVLDQLQRFSEYRTEPYVTPEPGNEGLPGNNIIKLS